MISSNESTHKIYQLRKKSSQLLEELTEKVYNMLQTIFARLVEPGILLGSVRISDKGCNLSRLRSHLVKDREEDAIEDANPKVNCKCASMIIEYIKQHFQRCLPDFFPRIKS